MSSVYGFSILTNGSKSRTFGFSLPKGENRIRILKACGALNTTDDLNVKILDSLDQIVISGYTSNGYFYFPFSQINGAYKIQINNSVNIQNFNYVIGEPIILDYLYFGRIYKVRATGGIDSGFSNELEI